MALGEHLVQALPSVYTLQCLTGKVDNNNDMYLDALLLVHNPKLHLSSQARHTMLCNLGFSILSYLQVVSN